MNKKCQRGGVRGEGNHCEQATLRGDRNPRETAGVREDYGGHYGSGCSRRERKKIDGGGLPCSRSNLASKRNVLTSLPSTAERWGGKKSEGEGGLKKSEKA